MNCSCDSESRCELHRAVTVLTVTDHFGRVTQSQGYNEDFATILSRACPFGSRAQVDSIPCWMTY